jgi:SsrA-binding protein
MAKKKSTTKKIQNRRAKFDYAITDEFVAGIVLNGRETKSLRLGRGHLRGAYVTVKDGELWLLNATITGSNNVPLSESEQTQSRKLLLKKREIAKLIGAKQQGLSIIPLELLTTSRYIKLKIGVGKGKKRHDKREIIKKRDQTREAQRSLKQI